MDIEELKQKEELNIEFIPLTVIFMTINWRCRGQRLLKI